MLWPTQTGERLSLLPMAKEGATHSCRSLTGRYSAVAARYPDIRCERELRGPTNSHIADNVDLWPMSTLDLSDQPDGVSSYECFTPLIKFPG